MMNPKRGLAETISCVAMEDPWCLATSLKIWSKRKTPVETRRAKQQTRSSGGPNQLINE